MNATQAAGGEAQHDAVPEPAGDGFGRVATRLAPLLAEHPAAMVAAALVPFAVVGGLTFANTSDDPLITMRYAFNLLHHGQPVFNLGDRVEGYTSPLHLLLATLLLMLPGGAVLLKLKLASIAFAGAALWQTGRLSRAVGAPRWAQLATMIAVAGSWNFMVSAGNALETSLVAFLVTGAVASLASAEHRWWRPALWTGALALARPDAVLVIVCLAAVSLTRDRSRPWRDRAGWLLGPAVTLAALLSFRLAYFGQLVPNTYYAKQLSLSSALREGWSYLVHSQPLAGRSLGLLVLALQAGLIFAATRKLGRSRPAVAYAVAAIVAQVLFVFASGGDWMMGGRFLDPAIPAATVLAFAGLATLLARETHETHETHEPRETRETPETPETPETRGRMPARRHRMMFAAFLLLVLVEPVSHSSIAPVWTLQGTGDRAVIASSKYPFGRLWAESPGLAGCLRPGQTAAYSEVGLFGFEHLRLRVIDTRGLTDAEIARTAPSAAKYPYGIADAGGYRADSPLGRVLVRRRPAMIISFDFPTRRTILGGRYRLARTVAEPLAGETLGVYLPAGAACAASA